MIESKQNMQVMLFLIQIIAAGVELVAARKGALLSWHAPRENGFSNEQHRLSITETTYH